MKNLLIYFAGLVLLFASCKDDDDNPGPSKDYEWQDGPGHVRVYLSGAHTFVITADNTLWGRGRSFNNDPQTNDKGYYKIAQDVLRVTSDGNSLFYLKTDKSVWGTLNYLGKPIQTQSIEKIIDNARSVQAGVRYVTIVKEDDTVWAMGINTNGQFGDGTSDYNARRPLAQIATDVNAVAAGYNTLYLLKTDKTLWSAGGNNYDKLGYASKSDQKKFKQFAKDVIMVKARFNNVFLIKTDRSAWSFGANVSGSLGLGNREQPAPGPIKVAEQVLNVFPNGITSLLMKTDHSLYAAGGSTPSAPVQYQHLLAPDSFTLFNERVNTVANGEQSIRIAMMRNGTWYVAGENEKREIAPTDEPFIASWQEMILPD
ncbi:RCC1 domain-containing protein [Sphingobacterium puteale]|uniref:RCC1 domain-containing protein n=1 Tax=Sphingobacterium puteale TaxID=2420510 RepID=UPI003D95DA1F